MIFLFSKYFVRVYINTIFLALLSCRQMETDFTNELNRSNDKIVLLSHEILLLQVTFVIQGLTSVKSLKFSICHPFAIFPPVICIFFFLNLHLKFMIQNKLQNGIGTQEGAIAQHIDQKIDEIKCEFKILKTTIE